MTLHYDLTTQQGFDQLADVVEQAGRDFEARMTEAAAAYDKTGHPGIPNHGELARLQSQGDGRPWVHIINFPYLGSDHTEDFYGPVIEESETGIRIDVSGPMTFAKKLCIIKRAQ